MKVKLVVLLSLAFIACASADEASHQKAALDLVSLTDPESVMKNSFLRTMESTYARMKEKGSPDAMIAEFKQAMENWYNAEIKYDEIKPKIAALYAKAFTEAEIKDLTTFFKSPLGQKLQSQQPVILGESTQIGKAYAESKQGNLRETLQTITQKYAK
jgi:hypothetical protein